MPNTDIQIYDLASDTLIGDKGIVTPAESHKKPDEQWKLADWIESMKTWPGLHEELGLKKYGHRKLAEKLNAQYQGLAIHMEYHLLHQRGLESQIYSEPLLSLIPQANLMLASHDYITRKFWPVLGWLWKPSCSDADSLWSLFEYSLCYKGFCKSIEGKRQSKKVGLSNLGRTIRNTQTCLEDIAWQLQRMPFLPTADSVSQNNTFYSAWLELHKLLDKDPLLHLHKLVFFYSEMQIGFEGDKTLIKAYQDYLHAWSRYREEIALSGEYGFWNLQLPDHEPIWSERRGRPPKQKAIQPKAESRSRRGSAIGSKRKTM